MSLDLDPSRENITSLFCFHPHQSVSLDKQYLLKKVCERYYASSVDSWLLFIINILASQNQ